MDCCAKNVELDEVDIFPDGSYVYRLDGREKFGYIPAQEEIMSYSHDVGLRVQGIIDYKTDCGMMRNLYILKKP